jgi:hypothetical protein
VNILFYPSRGPSIQSIICRRNHREKHERVQVYEKERRNSTRQ